MKQIVTIILMVLCCSVFANDKRNLVYLGFAGDKIDNSFLLYAYKNTIKNKKFYSEGWISAIFVKDFIKDVTFIRCYCEDNKIDYLDHVQYKKTQNGWEITKKFNTQKITNVVPDSIGEVIFNYICYKKIKKESKDTEKLYGDEIYSILE